MIKKTAMAAIASAVVLSMMLPRTITSDQIGGKLGYKTAIAEELQLSAVSSGSIEFNNIIRPVYDIFATYGLDFLNIDFSDYDLDIPGNEHIIKTARSFVPYDLNEDKSIAIMNASDLQAFMKEAYNIDLPFESIGMYTYDEADNTFSFNMDFHVTKQTLKIM